MRGPKSGRLIAAIGLALAAAAAGIAAWLLSSRAPQLPPATVMASTPTPEIAPSPPETAAPFVAHRRKPPPPPYLPPYEKPKGPLLVDLLRGETRSRDTEIHFPRLFGRVVSAAGATPIRDAVVGVPNEFESGREFEKYVLDVGNLRVVARTDGEGRFELAESVVGSTMLVSCSGFGPQIFDRAWLGPTHDAPFVIELAAAAKLDVRVGDHFGAPKAGIEIRLMASGYEATPRRDLPHDGILLLLVGAQRVTDENGAATFAQLPANVPFDVELWSAGSLLVREPSQLVLEPEKVTSKEWRLGAGSTVTGRVIDDAEQPVGGTTLWLTQRGVPANSSIRRTSLDWHDREENARESRTDSEGRFKIEDVAPGRWWLGVAPPKPQYSVPEKVDEDAVAPVAEVFEVDPQGSAVDLLLRVHRGLYIRGKAVDSEGEPVMAAIFASESSGPERFLADASTEDATGRFVLGPLEPGDYSIHARPFSGKLDAHGHWTSGAPLLPIDSIVVTAGRDDVVLRFGRGASIKATAIRADTGADAPAAFFLAHAEPTHHWISAGFEPSTSIQFHDIEPGDYSLSAVTSDGRAGCVPELHVAEGQVLDGVIVRVEPGARLRLSYRGTTDDYAQVTILAGATVYGADGIKRNTTSTFVAPTGPVTVRWRVGEDRFEEKVELSVGEIRELVWPRAKEDAPTDQGD